MRVPRTGGASPETCPKTHWRSLIQKCVCQRNRSFGGFAPCCWPHDHHPIDAGRPTSPTRPNQPNQPPNDSATHDTTQPAHRLCTRHLTFATTVTSAAVATTGSHGLAVVRHLRRHLCPHQRPGGRQARLGPKRRHILSRLGRLLGVGQQVALRQQRQSCGRHRWEQLLLRQLHERRRQRGRVVRGRLGQRHRPVRRRAHVVLELQRLEAVAAACAAGGAARAARAAALATAALAAARASSVSARRRA